MRLKLAVVVFAVACDGRSETVVKSEDVSANPTPARVLANVLTLAAGTDSQVVLEAAPRQPEKRQAKGDTVFWQWSEGLRATFVGGKLVRAGMIAENDTSLKKIR